MKTLHYITDILKCIKMLAPPMSFSALKQRLPAIKMRGKFQIDPKATYNTSVEV